MDVVGIGVSSYLIASTYTKGFPADAIIPSARPRAACSKFSMQADIKGVNLSADCRLMPIASACASLVSSRISALKQNRSTTVETSSSVAKLGDLACLIAVFIAACKWGPPNGAHSLRSIVCSTCFGTTTALGSAATMARPAWPLADASPPAAARSRLSLRASLAFAAFAARRSVTGASSAAVAAAAGAGWAGSTTPIASPCNAANLSPRR